MNFRRNGTDVRDFPETIPVFPLTRALLLPRSELPLRIFEPRYVNMIDDAMAGSRLVGMVQPIGPENAPAPELFTVGCCGRITALAEAGDARYLITLTGVCRFRIIGEEPTSGPYRKCRVSYSDFVDDLKPDSAQDLVNRGGIIETLRVFAQSSNVDLDWSSIDAAPTETLVNALAMMSPFGPQEKQSLLEAKDLRVRAEMLIALAEMDLAQRGDEPQRYH